MIKQNAKNTHGALIASDYPEGIPAGCKWLGGEGYGVWFLITKPAHLSDREYRIRRYSHTGNLDCDRIIEYIKTIFDSGVVSNPINNLNPCVR